MRQQLIGNPPDCEPLAELVDAKNTFQSFRGKTIRLVLDMNLK